MRVEGATGRPWGPITHRSVGGKVGGGEGMLQAAFGTSGRTVALVSLAIACFTANAAHLQFISDLFVKLNGEGGGYFAVGIDCCTKEEFSAFANEKLKKQRR